MWPQVETLLAVDDNLLPYSTVPLDSAAIVPGSPSYTAKSFDAFVVALPDKIYYPADAIEAFSRRVEGWLAGSRAPNDEPLQLRRYFITTVSRLREYARKNYTHLGDTLVGLMMRLETAQFVWVDGVLQRSAMGGGTRCREGHRRRDSEPEGSGADMVAAR